MIPHLLFPTLVCEFQYPHQEEFKKVFFRHALNHFDKEGYSHEGTGHVIMHHEPAFKDLYIYLSECVQQYLGTLHIDYTNFDINIVKSWLNVLDRQPTPFHSHKDAQISFVYYVNIPDDKPQPIRFYNEMREPFDGCIKYNNSSGIWDNLNSYTWSFTPREGNIFVFPASLSHDTIGDFGLFKDAPIKTENDLMNRRICIASDAVLTYSQKSAKPLGIQPVSNWRKFI